MKGPGIDVAPATARPPVPHSRWQWLDAIKGFAILVMFFDHCAPYFKVLAPYARHTFEFLGLVSMAEIFVLTSGVSAGLAYLKRWEGVADTRERTRRIARRCLRIYLAHIATVGALVLLIAWKPEVTPHLGEGASQDPFELFAYGLVLLYQPRLLNVLPLYVVLYLFLVPLLKSIERWAPARVLGVSSAIWFVSLYLPDVTPHRVQGALMLSPLNILSWQLLFVLGLCIPGFVGSDLYAGISRRTRAAVFLLCAAVVLFFVVNRYLALVPASGWWVNRGRIGPLRALDVLALLGCALASGPLFRSIRPPSLLMLLGTRALTAYTVSLLVINLYEFTIFRTVLKLPGWEQLLVFGVLTAIMCGVPAATAWWSARRKAPEAGASEARDGAKEERLWPIFFWAPIAILPVLLIDGFGNGFTEPKLAALLILAVGCGSALMVRVARDRDVGFDGSATILALLLVLRAVGLTKVENLGLAYQSVGLAASALVLVVFVRTFRPRMDSFARALIPAALVVIAGAAAMIVFRKVLFSSYASFGSTIGLKNSVSVFLAQLVPLFLFGAWTSFAARSARGRAAEVLYGAVMVAAIYVIFANRTRSSWWMLIVYGGILALFALKQREGPWRRLLGIFSGAALAAMVLVAALPDGLRWRSGTPYIDSMQTLASVSSSNGRELLWRIASVMIRERPIVGFGAGTAPAQWQGYISLAQVDPMSFRFLRNDLPLFNDYLQEAVETGVFGAMALAVAAFVLPLRGLKREYCKGRSEPATVLCGALCIATAVDALFDYPLNRPETVMMFALALGYLSLGERSGEPQVDSIEHGAPAGSLDHRGGPRAKLPELDRRIGKGLVLIFGSIGALFLAFVLSQLMIGLGSRKMWGIYPETRYLERALEHWPWDIQWDTRHLVAIDEGGDRAGARRLAERRTANWPFDPESYRMKAVLAEREGRFGEAMQSFRRAILMINGGRCNVVGYEQYRKYISRPEVLAQVTPLSSEDLAQCLR